ncbi:recombinase family protein [Mesorhizobium sp. M0938]|uniref:recombinase family protein n=1 Tax=unclassified Mesorhizobium TaxID=325217 RepID=UPI003337F29E
MALATQLTITETPRSRISCGSAACVLKKQGWTVVHSNTHRAICGASLLRPGLQELISDAMQGKFLIVLAEAMDRLTMTAQTGSRPGWANVATDPSRKFIDS